MAVSRLADRRIRAAATQAALRLDVRGPVSEALGKTGIAVPPAEDAAAPLAEADRQPAPRARTVGRGLQPTLKPFKETPWPTRRAAGAEPASLSGLTADERRVHRILLDTLDLTARQGDYGSGLSYAEKKRLEALDLAFINAQLAKMDRTAERSATFGKVGALGAVFSLGVVLALALSGGIGGESIGIAVGMGLMLLMAAGLSFAQTSSPVGGQRRKIYEALRELALLVEPHDATSNALAEADRLIDTLALGDLGEAPDAAASRRTRVRS